MRKRKVFISILLLVTLSLPVLAGEIEFTTDDNWLYTAPFSGEQEEVTPSSETVKNEEPTAQPTQTAVKAVSDYETTHPIPAKDSNYSFGEEPSYWNTPMDISRPDLIWEAMLQPITVLKGNEKQQYQMREEPSKDSKAVGDVTYASQAVRVIETLDNGWSLVETYSSSFHYSEVKAWGEFVQGYVETKLLEEKPPVGDYGIVIDKFTQRLYIIKDYKVYTTMIIATGLAFPEREYQETRSGEYLIVSAVGAFKSDDGRETFELALRYNAGDLIHKTPYILRGETKNYSTGEAVLGEKASHGCIRVQRKRTPEGVNQDWLWKNRKMGTRVWIWEDYQGRQLDAPSDDLTLYYNPNGGENYHSQEKCFGVKDKFLPLTPFTYGQITQGDFANLTPCDYCNPPIRPETREALNALYAIKSE